MAGLAVLGLMAAVSCAQGNGDVALDNGAASATQSENGALPTLPPLDEQYFDESGCLLIDEGQSDCSSDREALESQRDGTDPTGLDADPYRQLRGFVGRQWNETPLDGAGLVLLDGSLSVATDGTWSAVGLVRNDGTRTTGGEVSARLFDSEGALLHEAVAELPVGVLRPGEPAPFRLEAPMAVADVASLEWGLQEIDAGEVSRDFEIGVFWQRDFGDQRSLDHYAFRDDGSTHPAVVFGSVDNLGGSAGVSVVAAWVDRTGRVLALVDGGLPAPGHLSIGPAAFAEQVADAPAPSVAGGGSHDFLVVLGGHPDPDEIDDADLYLWVVGR